MFIYKRTKIVYIYASLINVLLLKIIYIITLIINNGLINIINNGLNTY